MARIPTVPPKDIQLKLKGSINYTIDRGVAVAKKWPAKRRGKGTPAQQAMRAKFNQWVQDLKGVSGLDIEAAKELAIYSGYTYRDILSRASIGRLIQWDLILGAEGMTFDVQGLLDQLGTAEGLIIIRSGTSWYGYPKGSPGEVLTIDPVTELPLWLPITDTGITRLTGDVLAGPGSGSVAAALAATAVTPGSYTNTNLTVDSKGRITTASNGSAGAGITQLTGPVTAGPGTGSQATTITASGVAAGSYTSANLTVGADGRLTAAASGTPSVPSAALHPGYVGGRMYTAPYEGVYSTVQASTGTLYAIPVPIMQSITVTGMQVSAVNSIVGAQMRLGIYADGGGVPGALVLDAGVVGTAAIGMHSITGLTQALTPGIYWLAMNAGALQQFRGMTAGGSLTDFMLGKSPTGISSQGSSHYSKAHAFGALPNPFGAGTLAEGNSFVIWFLV